jgi:hypothetical protein
MAELTTHEMMRTQGGGVPSVSEIVVTKDQNCASGSYSTGYVKVSDD